MGTRADFYIGRGKDAEWLGSIAWDGNPGSITLNSDEKEQSWPGGPDHFKRAEWPKGQHLFDAKTEAEFKERLSRFFERRDDVTLPEKGWPWPWNDSRTTDYSYAFDDYKVFGSCFGHEWFDPFNESYDADAIETEKCVFPNMEYLKNVTLGQRSGVIVVGGP